MIAFIIKSGICMILFFGLYWLCLRKEKLFTFNRYYLIFSVLFSLTVPFVSIPINLGYQKVTKDIVTVLNSISEVNPVQDEIAHARQETASSGTAGIIPASESGLTKPRIIESKKILLLFYLAGLILMLVRFCRNILLVTQMYSGSEKIDHEWYKIALLDHHVNPFSFLRTIFVNKQDYLGNRIAPNVLRHELEHVRQSHSRDVLFFEILHIVFWFNPVLFLYKWAARINHEYLADEAVIRSYPDIKTYATELINFISRRVSVPFTSGFSPSMIRLRLLMLNTRTTKSGRNIRILITLFTSVLLMSFISIRPSYPDLQGRKIKAGSAKDNKDIVIEDMYFRGPDFKPLKALVLMDGKELDVSDTIAVDPQQIKTIDVLTDRDAIRKYGKRAKDGVLEINTWEFKKRSVPDSLNYKAYYTVNDKLPEGTITIPVANLYSVSIWTYPVFPNQGLTKRWRTIGLMTRDFYKIRGKVVQKNGEPLPGVEVTATDNNSRVITDNDGRFLLEDVRSGALAELSAEGFEPFYFKATGVVFTLDLTITLDRKNESTQNNISASYNIRDFSGTWKFNKELSKTFLPEGIVYVYDVHQYDSDSIMINVNRIMGDGKEYRSIISYVFNTVKTTVRKTNVKYVTSCSIAPDGQSFSINVKMSSILGLFKDQGRTETYSLNEDEKQLIIRSFNFRDGPSNAGEAIQLLVFERI